jgi:carboxypeptidase C (cathepsin A)
MHARTLLLALLAAFPALADDKTPPPEPAPVVTEHERTIGGALLAYRATAGRMPLLDDAGKPRAHVFFVAYEMKGADAAKRPVTFVFNGGPGSPSLWLHLGTVGPKRVTMSDEGMAPVPPGRFVVNDETWLDLTDLVFIDPVGTGYSRPAKGRSNSSSSFFLDGLGGKGMGF